MARSFERDFKGAHNDLIEAKELKVNIDKNFERILIDSLKGNSKVDN
jgi:hypothetical protein